jgi:hypothetical protein
MQRSARAGNGGGDLVVSAGEDARLGLCARCRHARPITSGKGSTFLLCGLAAEEPRFPRYPRLPVLACAGFVPEVEEPAHRR